MSRHNSIFPKGSTRALWALLIATPMAHASEDPVVPADDPARALIGEVNLSVVGWGAQSLGAASPSLYNFGQVLTSPELVRSSDTDPSDGVIPPLQPGEFNGSGFFVTDQLTSETVGIACGEFHTLLLKRDGSISARGWNPVGQTSIPASVGPAISIACGADHNLAVRPDGTVAAWGWNEHGQCNVPEDLRSVVAVAGGAFHSLALLRNGTVVAWGNNMRGQCDVPPDLTDVRAISAGALHSMALRTDGTVIVWGDNRFWQRQVPKELDRVIAICAGAYFNVALRDDGTVVAWGNNTSGQTAVPEDLVDVVEIAAGEFHALALKADQTVVAWGDNSYGCTIVPDQLGRVVAIAAGGYHSQALVQIAPPLRIAPVQPNARSLNIDINLPAGRRYRLEQSPDLESWSEHKTDVVVPGRMSLQVPRSTTSPNAFFRAILLTP